MSASVWECRICGRRIPLRVDECFCGAKRQQVVAQQQREAERSPTRIPLDVALLVAMIVVVGVFGLRYALRSEAPAPAGGRTLLSGAFATPEPLPSLVPPTMATAAPSAPASAPAATLPPLADSGTPPPLTLAPRPSAPTAPATPEVDEREMAKVAALAAYVAEIDKLVATSARLTEHVAAYNSGCVGNAVAGFTNCADIQARIMAELSEIEQGLDAAEDVARRAWVEPGKLRDARDRTLFGRNQWVDLQRSARQVGR